MMNDQIIVYQKPTCSKCRELDRYLRESGVPFENVNYYIKPLTGEKLRDLLAKMKLAPQDLLRKSEPLYRELKLSQQTRSDDQLIALMIEHPDLMQRPIIERGSRAVLGRPIENVKEVMSDE